MDKYLELEKLKKLLDDGILSQEEFQSEKEKILGYKISDKSSESEDTTIEEEVISNEVQEKVLIPSEGMFRVNQEEKTTDSSKTLLFSVLGVIALVIIFLSFQDNDSDNLNALPDITTTSSTTIPTTTTTLSAAEISKREECTEKKWIVERKVIATYNVLDEVFDQVVFIQDNGFNFPNGIKKLDDISFYDFRNPQDELERKLDEIEQLLEGVMPTALYGLEIYYEGYKQFINIDSFIDFFILNEISKNVDAYRISTFMHKEKGEKLNMGPIWDFNIAFGNADYCDGNLTSGWAYRFGDVCPLDGMQVPFWWKRLMQDSNYLASLEERWTSLRSNVLSDENILELIDELVIEITESGAVEQNFGKWLVLGKYIWPNNFVGNRHSEEIDYLKQWIIDRLSWIDQQIITI